MTSGDTLFSQALAKARVQARSGATTVIDELLKSQLDEALLNEQLSKGGIVSVFPDMKPDFSVIDAAAGRSLQAVVVVGDGQKFLALADPWDEGLLNRLWLRGLQNIALAAASKDLLNHWLNTGTQAVQTEMAMAEDDEHRSAVDFVAHSVDAGIGAGASDVHFECDRYGVTAKHRVDGLMVKHERLDGVELAQEVVSRIKVLAQLDITERRLPQDGRFRHTGPTGPIDMRVSIMPSVFGEDAVLRLLDKSQLREASAAVTLDALGFEDAHVDLIRSLASEPSGMVLVTGPTGSGKTTTVYAALSEINTGQEKIITIEDPVEYELPGVLQIPVNERKGLTFAKGLRSILRHDPDRILVGEIRDGETAEIAVQSALTGHLVFTTVHANTVADIMGRFRHFGLDMFGFMSSLNGVVVQRLMRHVCPNCTIWRAPSAAESNWLQRHGLPDTEQVPAVVGCANCGRRGYLGRFVLAEVHVIDDVFRDLVIQTAPVTALRAHSRAQGVKALAEQAACRVVAGLTTMEEVKRVVGWL